MVLPSYSVSVLRDGSLNVQAVAPPHPPGLQLFRQPHDVEMRRGTSAASLDRVYMGDGARSGPVRESVAESGKTLPEVYRLTPDHQTALPPSWIRLWRDLNPMYSTETFITVLGNTYAWTNNTGWPGRKNCLTGELMDDPLAKDPAFHAPLINGGALLKGQEVDGYLLIDSMSTGWAQVPTAEWVLERPWYWFYGTQVNPDGVVTFMTRTGTDGQRHPIRVPFVTRLPVSLPLAWLDRLPVGFIPSDPRWMP